jgi:hypothetical protein
MTQDAKVTLFNPNTTPVVCDKDGRIVEGGGRREVDKVDKVGQEAVDHGLLVLEEPEQDETAEAEPSDKAAEPRKAPGASAPKKTP